MESKMLNLKGALRLSIVLGKYIKEWPSPDSSVIEFMSSIFDGLTPEDFKSCLEILTGEKLKETDGQVLFKVFFEGIEKNKLISLLMHSKEIGII